MKKNKSNAHEFALYWQNCSNEISVTDIGQDVLIYDAPLYHRIVKVLRFTVGDRFILFDRVLHATVQLQSLDTKNKIQVKLIAKVDNVQLCPQVVFFLPLLKRDACEQAIYSLVELGATEIRLMLTEKTQRKWGGQKEFNRLHAIMIAAAEQAKQFILPRLYEPKSFAQCLAHIDQPSPMFFFDFQGKDLFPLFESFRKTMPEKIFMMIGPEGDLTMQEKQILQQKNVQFYQLTATILRAQQAVTISLGMFRSLLR